MALNSIVEYGTVRFWDLSGNLMGQLKGAFGNVIFSPDGSLLAGSGEGSGKYVVKS